MESKKESFSTWMTVKETCHYLKLSETTIRNMIRQDKLPFVKIGRSIRINQKLLDDYLLA